jgi:hypothetical protein
MSTLVNAAPRRAGRRRTKIPAYRLHRGTGQAVVTLNGRDHYLGRHGTPESKERYERTISLWLMNRRQLPDAPPVDGRSVGQILDSFGRHAERRYVHSDGTSTGEHENFQMAAGPLRTLYASLPAKNFDAQALEVVRQRMIDLGWCRTTINRNVGRIRQIFRWAVAKGFISAEAQQRLEAVEAFRRGQTEAPEPRPVKPVPQAHIDAVLPRVSR